MLEKLISLFNLPEECPYNQDCPEEPDQSRWVYEKRCNGKYYRLCPYYQKHEKEKNSPDPRIQTQ